MAAKSAKDVRQGGLETGSPLCLKDIVFGHSRGSHQLTRLRGGSPPLAHLASLGIQKIDFAFLLTDFPECLHEPTASDNIRMSTIR